MDWNIIEMYNLDDNLSNQLPYYETIFTPDQEGVIIYYYITASNNLGQSSSYPYDNSSIMFVGH